MQCAVAWEACHEPETQATTSASYDATSLPRHTQILHEWASDDDWRRGNCYIRKLVVVRGQFQRPTEGLQSSAEVIEFSAVPLTSEYSSSFVQMVGT